SNTVNISGEGSSLTLNVNAVNSSADVTGETTNWIQDAIDMVGTVQGGITINLGEGIYKAGATVNKADVTVDGGGVARISATQHDENGLIVSSAGDGATITGLEIFGPADQAYNTYGWGGVITRGIVLQN